MVDDWPSDADDKFSEIHLSESKNKYVFHIPTKTTLNEEILTRNYSRWALVNLNNCILILVGSLGEKLEWAEIYRYHYQWLHNVSYSFVVVPGNIYYYFLWLKFYFTN